MPRGQLSIEDRQRITITRLKKSVAKLRQDKADLLDLVSCLQGKVADLEGQLADKESQRKQLLEKLYKPQRSNGKQPLGKKPGSRGFHRPNPTDDEVTEERFFTPTRCPYCKSRTLSKARETIVKYTEDIVLQPEKIVKKYVITKHRCENCGEYVRSDKVPSYLPRLGENLLAYLLYARYKLRLPYNRIQQSLEDLHDFHISEGEIALQLSRAKELFHHDWEAVAELIKVADKVYCDETGWRIGGKHFWIWVFATDKGVKYVVEDTRGKGVAERVLGAKEDRVLISDFYAAYKNIPGRNQYCWVHLLRDAYATETLLFDDLQRMYHELKAELSKPKEERSRTRLDKLLQKVVTTAYANAPPMVGTLQERIRRTKDQLLTCLDYDDVLPENNTAERALRNHVVMRKVFGGSRSLEGAKTMEVNTTVIDTLLHQEPDKGFFEIILPRIQELQRERALPGGE